MGLFGSKIVSQEEKAHMAHGMPCNWCFTTVEHDCFLQRFKKIVEEGLKPKSNQLSEEERKMEKSPENLELEKYKMLAKSRLFHVILGLSELNDMVDRSNYYHREQMIEISRKIFSIIKELPKVLEE